jgi:hypothetical protein
MIAMRSDIERAKASGPREGFITNRKLKLMDQVREVLRLKHCAIRTETCQSVVEFWVFAPVAVFFEAVL